MSDESTVYYTKDDTTGEYVEAQLPDPPGFHDSLPEDLREHEALKDVKDHGQLAQMYLEQNSKLPVVPESADGYEFEFPEGFDVDDETLTGFKNKAHELGLTQQQYQDALQFQVDREMNLMQEFNDNITQAKEAGIEALKKEWGDDYDKNTALVGKVFNRFADDDIKKMIEDTRFGDNPQVMRLLYGIGKVLSEDTLDPGTRKAQSDIERDEAGRPMLQFNDM